ncbi:MAG: hypothetical protein WC095_00425 [Candidatus Paceibacterota bacterium]
MKKFILIIILLAILGGGLWYKNQKIEPEKQQEIGYNEYNDTNFYFKYPKELSVINNGQAVSIFHNIPFENTGACDMEGEETAYPRLDDFGVQIQRFNTPLVETVKALSSYMPEENFANGKLLENSGFIDKVTIGPFSGFAIYEGVEGCGHTIYYFPTSENETLVITHDSIQTLSGVRGPEIVNEILKIPGAISKEKSNEIFNEIVSSLILK